MIRAGFWSKSYTCRNTNGLQIELALEGFHIWDSMVGGRNFHWSFSFFSSFCLSFFPQYGQNWVESTIGTAKPQFGQCICGSSLRELNKEKHVFSPLLSISQRIAPNTPRKNAERNPWFVISLSARTKMTPTINQLAPMPMRILPVKMWGLQVIS